MDFQKLADSIGFEQADYLELIELFVETSLNDIKKIGRAIEKNDPEAAAGGIHSIKGAAGNLGLMEIYDTAQKLESLARLRPLAEIVEPVNRLQNAVSDIAEQFAAL